MLSALQPGWVVWAVWPDETSIPAQEQDERASWIALARRGDSDAFDALMRADQTRLYRVALYVMGRPEDADEALQETFLKIHRHLGSYDPERAWEPWTYRIVVNVCRRMQRKNAARRWLSIEAWRERGGPDPVEPKPGPEARLAGVERRRLLAGALRRLPGKERAAVVLRDVEGLSSAEAAQVMGVSEGTVRSHTSRGRARLRKWLEGVLER